jgi:hypothetical protein
MTWSSHNEVVATQGATTTTTIDALMAMNMRHMEMLIHLIEAVSHDVKRSC